MFNYACATTNFRVDRVLGGLSRPDADSHRTLFCGKLLSNKCLGPDPADSNRVLIRKIV